MKQFAAAILTFVLSGCAVTQHQGYEGPAKPESELAIVRLWTPTETSVFSSPGLLMQKIDGKEAGDVGRSSHSYLLPGEHEFQVGFIQIKAYNLLCGALCDSIFNKPAIFRANVKAGKIYTMKFINDQKGTVVLQEQAEGFDRRCLNPREYSKDRC